MVSSWRFVSWVEELVVSETCTYLFRTPLKLVIWLTGTSSSPKLEPLSFIASEICASMLAALLGELDGGFQTCDRLL